MDLHSFIANPDPAVFLNAVPGADPDRALQNFGVTFELCKKLPYTEFYVIYTPSHFMFNLFVNFNKITFINNLHASLFILLSFFKYSPPGSGSAF